MELEADDVAEFLELSWSGDDGDGIGRLSVVAAANGFAGRARAWFDCATIEQFSEELARYPLDDYQRPAIAGGFGGADPQTHVALTAYPVGTRGQVAVGVELATELWRDDHPDRQHRVRLELPTTYERLRAFAGEVRRMTEHNGGSARIEAERLV